MIMYFYISYTCTTFSNQLGTESAGDVAMTSPDDVMLCHGGVGTSHSRGHMFYPKQPMIGLRGGWKVPSHLESVDPGRPQH